MDNIGELIHQQFPEDKFKGKSALCRFDLVARWPEYSKRRAKIFTYRADYYEKDPQKMLWSLVRFFLRSNHEWLFCQIRDNSRPENDPERIVLWYNKTSEKKIITNRLPGYAEMLKEHPLPDWLK